MSSPTNYSDLEVATYSNLHVDTAKMVDTHKEVVMTQQKPYAYEGDIGAPGEHGKGIICGLRRRPFFIIAAIVAVIIIVAAVGGGVGASISNKHKDGTSTAASAAPASSTNSSTITQTPTPTTATPTLSIHTTSDATHTLLSDCPSSNNTYYAPNGPIGQSPTFQKICGSTIRGTPQSDGNSVAVTTTNLDDCINLCAAYNLANRVQIAAGKQSVCNAVCWRSTIQDNDWPGMCFGFATQNSSGTWSLRPNGNNVCDSAGWINQDVSA
jgi:hypothetical protein